MDFVVLNGKVISKTDLDLTPFLRDEPFIVSQKVWFGYGGIPLFKENLESMGLQLKTLGHSLPQLFDNQRELFRLSKRMLNKNKFYRSGYIHIQFFVSSNTIQTLITSTANTTFEFPFRSEGILLNISAITKNSTSGLCIFKCHNQLLWNAANANLKDTVFQNSVLLNEKGWVCEGIASNLFMIKNKVLITPSLKTGGYNDVLRTVVLSIAKQLKLKVIETSEIATEHLFEMDELFFASEEFGLQWILGIDNKRFVHHYSDEIYEQINKFLKDKVS